MEYQEVNIGLLIRDKARELGVNKSELAKMIGIQNQNVNRILESENINTDKLIKISEALDFDFFSYYRPINNVEIGDNIAIETNGDFSPASINGNISVSAEMLLKERISYLEELLSEKERLIKLYEKMQNK